MCFRNERRARCVNATAPSGDATRGTAAQAKLKLEINEIRSGGADEDDYTQSEGRIIERLNEAARTILIQQILDDERQGINHCPGEKDG